MKQFTIIDAPDQQFSTILNNRRVTIRLRYNPTSEHWTLDLSIDDLPVLQGQKIVVGIDLLSAYNFGVGMIFAVATTAGAEPDRDALPLGLVRLYHATDAEFEDALDAAIST